jgi:oxygen-dependent protoporphyrinogen oxidase
VAQRVVVLGGGITGLTAAYRLLQRGQGAVEVTLVESRTRLGGNIVTDRHGGFIIDGGPDAFLLTKPHATQLCRDIGLGDRLIQTVERNRRVYLQRHGRLHSLPEGLMLTVPTRLLPFVRTPLVSWKGKARVALDLVLPSRADTQDESLAHFVRRRLGREVLDAIAEPLLGGIYAGDIHALSLQSTFPQLAELERKHGSLIRGALVEAAGGTKRDERRTDEQPRSPFYSLLGGMGELVDTLGERITRAGGTVHTGTLATSITNGGAFLGNRGPRLSVDLVDAAGARETVPADSVVVAIPAHAAAGVVEPMDPELARMLRSVLYLSTATVALGYAEADIRHPLDALGLLVPASEQRRMLAATFVTSKWAGRAPSRTVLLRVFVGGHREPTVLNHTDEALIALAKDELATVLGIHARPMISRVFRHEHANPQPIVGHADRVRVMRTRAAAIPGLYLAGAGFDGVGIPDCVRQGEDVAAQILGSRKK